MTNLATTPSYGDNLQKSFTSEPAYEFETWYVAWELWPFIFCSNDDPRLILTYFMARSNLVSYTFKWGNLLESHLMKTDTANEGLCFVQNILAIDL